METTSDLASMVKGSPSQYVKLNVGGSLHYTTIGTLTKHDNMLRAMFSGRLEVSTIHRAPPTSAPCTTPLCTMHHPPLCTMHHTPLCTVHLPPLCTVHLPPLCTMHHTPHATPTTRLPHTSVIPALIEFTMATAVVLHCIQP